MFLVAVERPEHAFGSTFANSRPMSARPPRLDGFSYVGLHRYSLTFCVQDRRHVFVDAALVESMLEPISQAARDCRFAILAYCFMPDHLHLLAEAEADESDLIRFAHAVKQRTGFEYRRRAGRLLWQKGYFEHVLRDDEMTLRGCQIYPRESGSGRVVFCTSRPSILGVAGLVERSAG